MASIRVPALRRLAALPLRSPRAFNQRRWAQVHDVRFLATTQAPHHVYEKYRAKLDQKAQQEGLGGIEELKAAYASQIDEQKKKDAIERGEIPQAPETPVSQPYSGPLDVEGEQKEKRDAPRRLPTGSDKPPIKALDDIIDLPKTRELPEKELTAIWRLRHASNPQTLCAVVPAAVYQTIEEAARKTPQFVLPVPHPTQGAEIHFLQWTFDAESKTSTVLFTQLAEYKNRGEFAQPHTTVTHHLDLKDDRGLVLLQGQVVDGRGVQPKDAQWLLLCLQRFYGGWEVEDADLTGERKQRAEERKKLLEWFASGDSRFTVEKLMEEAERMG